MASHKIYPQNFPQIFNLKIPLTNPLTYIGSFSSQIWENSHRTATLIDSDTLTLDSQDQMVIYSKHILIF